MLAKRVATSPGLLASMRASSGELEWRSKWAITYAPPKWACPCRYWGPEIPARRFPSREHPPRSDQSFGYIRSDPCHRARDNITGIFNLSLSPASTDKNRAVYSPASSVTKIFMFYCMQSLVLARIWPSRLNIMPAFSAYDACSALRPWPGPWCRRRPTNQGNR